MDDAELDALLAILRDRDLGIAEFHAMQLKTADAITALRAERDALKASIWNEYTDEQLERGMDQFRAIRSSLGESASEETICSAIYDGMLYPLRQKMGWTNTS